MPFRFLLGLLVALAAVAPTNVAAQTDPHASKIDAEARYQTAVRLFGEGRYREALDEFDAAIALTPESIFFCNRAIVLIQLTEVEAALESLETCQSTFTGEPGELAAIDAQRSAVDLVVRVVRPGTLDTVSAMTTPVVIQDPTGAGWTRASTGYVLLAAGGALLASAATFDILSSSVRDTLDDMIANPRTVTEEQFRAQLNEYKSRQRIWLLLTGGGALATLTGATLVVTHWLADDAASGVQVEASVVAGGGWVLVLSGAF